MFAQGVDALYVDLPLDRPESAHVSDALGELQLSYSGVFPTIRPPGTCSGCNACVTRPPGAATWRWHLPTVPHSCSTSSRTWRRRARSVSRPRGDGLPDGAVPLVAVRSHRTCPPREERCCADAARHPSTRELEDTCASSSSLRSTSGSSVSAATTASAAGLVGEQAPRRHGRSTLNASPHPCAPATSLTG